jgi:flagellar M-ring protein FliF
MNETIKGYVRRTTGTFSAFTPAQKAISVMLLAGLVIGGLFFSRWASAPSYSPLFSGLAPADASAIVEQLNASGTAYELADGGQTILVAKDAVYDTRVAISGQGLPAGDQTGYSLLDEQGITASEFRQRIDYQRALEGELTKTVQAIDGVETAVVHLAIPEKDVFADDDGKVTASVLVQTRPGVSLASGQVRAIVHLVASSIEGLQPDDVTVADASGKVLSTSADGAMGGGDDTRNTQTSAYEQRLTDSVQTMLEPLVGAGHAVVKVSADLNFDQRNTKTERFEAAPGVPPLASSTTEETYAGTGGAAVGGVLGPDNINVPNGEGAGNGDYSKTSQTVENAVTKVTEDSKAAPGAVERLGVAVLLDATTAGTVDPNAIRTLVSSAVGLDPQRGDTIEVQRQAFSTVSADSAAAELQAAKEADERAALMGTVKTAAIVIAVLLALGIAWLATRRSRKQKADVEMQKAQLEILRQQQQIELEAAARASLESAQAAAAELEAGVPGQDDGEGDRKRDEIGELVDSQPDEVAQLLRGWLADRRS